MAKLTLKTPLPFGKTEIKELTFRDYTLASDYLSFDQRGGVAQRIALIASLTSTSEELVMQLRGKDYRRAEQMAEALMAADERDDEPGEDENLTEEQKENQKK